MRSVNSIFGNVLWDNLLCYWIQTNFCQSVYGVKNARTTLNRQEEQAATDAPSVRIRAAVPLSGSSGATGGGRLGCLPASAAVR